MVTSKNVGSKFLCFDWASSRHRGHYFLCLVLSTVHCCKSTRAIVKSQGRGFPSVIFMGDRRKRLPNEAPRCSTIPRLLIAHTQHFVPLKLAGLIRATDTYVKYYHATIENRVSILDSRFSRGSRIECQLPFERYCITKLGLAEGEETNKSFKVLFVSLAKPQLKMTVIQNQGLLWRLKRWANLVSFSSATTRCICFFFL